MNNSDVPKLTKAKVGDLVFTPEGAGVVESVNDAPGYYADGFEPLTGNVIRSYSVRHGDGILRLYVGESNLSSVEYRAIALKAN